MIELVTKKEWKDADDNCFYFYGVSDGKIVGQVNRIGLTKVLLAKIIHNHNDETFLGQYISETFAKKAVEMYWDIQDRTLIE